MFASQAPRAESDILQWFRLPRFQIGMSTPCQGEVYKRFVLGPDKGVKGSSSGPRVEGNELIGFQYSRKLSCISIKLSTRQLVASVSWHMNRCAIEIT